MIAKLAGSTKLRHLSTSSSLSGTTIVGIVRATVARTAIIGTGLAKLAGGTKLLYSRLREIAVVGVVRVLVLGMGMGRAVGTGVAKHSKCIDFNK